MTETQESLQKFGVNAPKEPIERTRQPVDTISVLDSIGQYETGSLDEDLFPEIKGYNWEALPTRYDQIEAMEWWRFSSLARFNNDDREDPENIPGSGGIIVSGAKEYLQEHALTEIDLPKYYSRFENEVGTVHRWSVDGITHIDWQQIKRAVRLANGAGRIDTATTRVVLCDTGNLIVTGPRGCFIVEAFNSSYARREHALPQPPKEAVSTIQGLSIPEENPRMQDAIQRWVCLMKSSDFPTPTSHVQFIADDSQYGDSTVAHRFKTATGDEIEVCANDLNIVREQKECYDQIKRIHHHERAYRHDDMLYTAVVDELPGRIGETATIEEDRTAFGDGEEVTGMILGYRTSWEIERRVYGMSGRKRPVKLKYQVRTGLLQPDGSATVQTRDVAEFDLRKR